MSTLATVLMAAMSIPGNGPEMEFGEVEQRLDLRGKWEATYYHSVNPCPGAPPGSVWSRKVWFGKLGKKEGLMGFFSYPHENKLCWFEWYGSLVDEGRGRVRIGDRLGIYQQDGNNVRICLGDAKRRPISFRASFRADDSQDLLILHCVKPRK